MMKIYAAGSGQRHVPAASAGGDTDNGRGAYSEGRQQRALSNNGTERGAAMIQELGNFLLCLSTGM